MTHDEHDDESAAAEADRDVEGENGSRAKRDGAAPKERVLHTRVPAVLEAELKRLAETLRVPVSNVVRAILEDAVDAVDTVSERTENELIGFVDRLARHRDDLKSRLARARPAECPSELPPLLDGVIGYQPLMLASPARCGVCDREIRAGGEAHRALFDDPTKRVFVGPHCRLLPEKDES